MKRVSVIVAAAAALLTGCGMTATPSPSLSLLPPEPTYERDLRLQFCYEALPDSYTQELRQICRDCAAVEFEIRLSGVNTPFVLRAERGGGGELKPEGFKKLSLGKRAECGAGGELEPLLAELQAVPRWYSRRSLFSQINHEGSPCIRFYDAGGGVRHRIDIWPEGGVFAREGLEYVSLWELCRRHYTVNRPLLQL